MLKVTAKDALRNSILEPGWYKARCSEVKPGTDSKGAGLVRFEIEVISKKNGDTADANGNSVAGVPLKDYQVSERGVGFAIPFLIACGLPKEALEEAKKGKNVDVDERQCEGKEFYVCVSNTMWNNRMSNEATDFLPLD